MHTPTKVSTNGAELLPRPRPDKVTFPATYTDLGFAAGLDPSETDGAGLLHYWRMICRRKGTLFLVASIGASIGFLITIPQTPIYQAKTSLEIVDFNENFLNTKGVNPVIQAGASSDGVDIQTQVRLLQSDSLLDRVVTKVRSAPPSSTNVPLSRLAAWRKVLKLNEQTPYDSDAEALSFARRNLRVRVAVDTRIVEVSIDSPSPDIAASFANTLANEFIDQSLEARWKTSEHTSEWLTKQLDDIRIRLERSEDQMQEYARRAGLVFTDEKTNVSEEKLRQVQQSLSTAQADRIEKQSRWELASSNPLEALPASLNKGNLEEYQTKITELTRQAAELGATYTSDYGKVKRIQAQIAPLQEAIKREREDLLGRLHTEYEGALRREKLLAADYASQRGIVTGEGEKAIQYNILKREVDSNRQLYDAMLQQLKQASLSAALRASNIRVVDPAKPPRSPYKPEALVSSSIGMFAGLFLGTAFIIMRERADRTIQDPGEAPLYLNLPELGIIPADQPAPRIRLKVVAQQEATDLDATSRGQTEVSGETPSVPLRQRVELVTLQRKPSMVAESFRATLVSILFSHSDSSRPRVMVVTSANMGEGKSTVVSNLGIAVAEVNHKVLLIDADMRKPRLHEIFGLANDRGLSDLLRSTNPLDSLPAGVIQETSVPDLFVLTSGPTTSSASSLLYSSRMLELLRKLRTEFDTVFLDTPPMLQIPDARVLGRMVDRVILVVRARKTTRDAAQAAKKRFADDGTSIMGTILNDWDPKHSASGYYGYYGGYGKGYKGYYTQG